MWHKISFNLIPFVLKSEKNWAIEEISKKTSVPPLFAHIFHFTTIFGGTDFFWNSVNRSIFLRFWNEWHQIVWKSNPLIYRYQNNLVSTRLGRGEEPMNYSLPLKKILICKLRGSPPPILVNTKSFWYLDIRGLLFWTIRCH